MKYVSQEKPKWPDKENKERNTTIFFYYNALFFRNIPCAGKPKVKSKREKQTKKKIECTLYNKTSPTFWYV